MQEIDFSLAGMYGQMGITAKAVGLILIIMSMWSLHVMIDRLIAFYMARRQSVKALAEGYEQLYQGRLDEGVQATLKYPKAVLGQIMAAAVRSYLQDKERGQGFNVEAADRIVEKVRGLVVANMKRGLTSLATVSATAPFVGLFGTVAGIINAFVGMAKTGSGGLGAVSAGIAEALITTAFGLAVAIPAVWVFNYFNGQVEDLQTEIDTTKADVLDYLIRSAGGKAHAKTSAG